MEKEVVENLISTVCGGIYLVYRFTVGHLNMKTQSSLVSYEWIHCIKEKLY